MSVEASPRLGEGKLTDEQIRLLTDALGDVALDIGLPDGSGSSLVIGSIKNMRRVHEAVGARTPAAGITFEQVEAFFSRRNN